MAVRYGGRRYSSPQSPGMGMSAPGDRLGESSAVLVAREPGRRPARCPRGADLSPSLAPTMTAPTAGSSRMAPGRRRSPSTPRASARRRRRPEARVWNRSQPPAALDEAAVLHLRPGGELVCRRRGPAQPPLGEESPGERPVREQLRLLLGAERRHPPRRASNRGARRRPGSTRDESRWESRPGEMRGVEVHRAEVTRGAPRPGALLARRRAHRATTDPQNRQAWNWSR